MRKGTSRFSTVLAVGAAFGFVTPAVPSDPPGPEVGPGEQPTMRIGYGESAADLNRDGFVDSHDLCVVVMNWGCDTTEINLFLDEPVYCDGDCNQDFVVDARDFCAVITNWGACP